MQRSRETISILRCAKQPKLNEYPLKTCLQKGICKHVGGPKVNENMLKRALITEEQIDQQPISFSDPQYNEESSAVLSSECESPGR